MSHKAPKQWSLTTDESMTSFTNWKENLMYTLSLDRNFSRFLSPEVTWTEVCDEHPHRGLTDDPTSIPADERHSKEIKCTHLNLLLGQIANYANIISRNQIVQESTSINSIWAMIREHYGFHVTGSRFLDLSSIRLKTGEKPADLYQRIVSFFNDNLFTTSSNLKHNGKDPVRDDRISVSLQNTIVVLWLERLHVVLPGLVKQRYGAELRNKTLASIKPEISMALDSLLDELRSSDDTRILCSQIPRSNFGRGSRTTPGSYSKPKEQSYYNPKVCCLLLDSDNSKPVLCRASSTNNTIFPGEIVSIQLPPNFPDGSDVIVEPRTITKTYAHYQWPAPQISKVIAGELSLVNNSNDVITIHKNEHVCQVRATSVSLPFTTSSPTPKTAITQHGGPFSTDIKIDKQLEDSDISRFQQLHQNFDDVFQPSIGRYNDHSGKVRARVNIGNSKPPTKKLHVPNYSGNNQQILQDKFDELERQGVFVRPEDVGVTIEHVSPSFLVRKPSGGYRLVTAFTSIGEYCKTLPTSMPTVDDTLRNIASWKYMITTDLCDSFYQIPMEKCSMKWCGTQTPFRGLRCYAVSAQGMPGSSETLEEMMCTVLGHLVQEGCVSKIADDMYIGGQSIDELFNNWQRVLTAIQQNGLKLKSSKTTIAPTHTQILGWDWNNGSISASSHKITPLATCEPPTMATAMRSFIGAFKVFNRVLKGCARYLSDLDASLSGKQKQDKIIWTDALSDSFRKAQSALQSSTSIVIPVQSDQLIITHDGSQVGIGSILFVKRNENIHLGGFFSAKLKTHHSRWLPCELEALSIASSINHFSPYIRESIHRTQILTDNKPCVQAWSKMTRGEFSTSARVATFLSSMLQYNIELHGISGQMNLPSDFHSRNPPSCQSSCCQICKFVTESEDIVVRSTTVEEILSGHKEVPYVNRQVWKSLQPECPDLRRVHAHLSSGTRPTNKQTNMTPVKQYLHNVVSSRDGLLVVMHDVM